jgi:hypothetical protein
MSKQDTITIKTLLKDLKTTYTIPPALKKQLRKHLLAVDIKENVLIKNINPIINMADGRKRRGGLANAKLSDVCHLLALHDYDVNKALKYVAKKLSLSYANLNRTYGSKLRKIVNEFDTKELLAELQDLRKKFGQRNKIKKKQDNAVTKAKELLSYFNIPTTELAKKLEDIKKSGEQSTQDYLSDLYMLRQLFIAKAKGDITTTQTEALWEVEFDEEIGKYRKKQIYKNSKDKQFITIRTQSHLPDEKAILGVRIIDDLILQVEAREQVELTEADLLLEYERIKQKAEQDRARFADALLNGESEIIDVE